MSKQRLSPPSDDLSPRSRSKRRKTKSRRARARGMRDSSNAENEEKAVRAGALGVMVWVRVIEKGGEEGAARVGKRSDG